MKKRVLAGILMMILVLASAMTVSAAGSKEQGSKEAGVRVVTPADKFEEYKKKVDAYLSAHMNDEAINKLRTNQPLTQEDFDKLLFVWNKIIFIP